MRDLLPKIDSEDGLFHNGNPATGTQGTRVNDTWLNNVQEHMRDFGIEIRYLLAKAELTADPAKQTQIYDAIKVIIGKERPLYSGYDSDSESLGATAKVIKILKGFIDSNTRSFANYIPNSKKSNAVNSTSSDTVATSFAAKTAYDKGVEALNKANTKADSVNPILTTNKWYGDMNTVPNGTLFFAITETTKNHPHYNQGAFDAQAWQFDVGNQKVQMIFYTESDIKVRCNDDGVNWSDWTSFLTERNLSAAVNNSSNTVPASVAGVKSAYDRGTTALNQANTANNNANGRVSKSGDTMSGHLIIKNGEYSSVRTFNTANQEVRWESAPSTGNYFAAVVGAIKDSVVYKVMFPKKTGTTVLDTEFSSSGGANTYVKTDGAGDLNARCFRNTYQNESRIQGAIAFRVNNSNDNYTRYCNNPSAVRDWLGLHAIATRLPTVAELGFTQNINDTGWTKFPNGLIIQWGFRTNTGNITFPIAFNKIFSCISQKEGGGDSAVRNLKNTGATLHGDGKNSWIAIGR